MFKNIAHTGMAMAFTFILSMASTIILGNMMTPDEFGDYALLKNFILIGATFSILGRVQLDLEETGILFLRIRS